VGLMACLGMAQTLGLLRATENEHGL
jgi:hypothetical protein